MKLVQLLSGAAVAALLAGAAQAQTYSDTAGVAGTDFVADGEQASEYDGALAGNVIITFASGGDDLFAGVGAGEDVAFDVTLTNAVFSTAVAAGAWDTDANADGTCEFGNVARGGGAGQAFIGWDSQEANLNLCDNIDFDANIADLTLPIERVDADLPVSINLSFSPVGNANFTEDSGDTTLVTYDAAYTPAATAGTEADNLLSIDGTATAGGFSGSLGTVSLGFAAGALREAAFAAAAAGFGADQVDVVVTFDDLTGVAGVDVNSAACVLDAGTNTATCDDVTLADIDDAAVDIDWTHDGVGPVAEQTPTVSVTVTSLANYALPGLAATALAPITYDDGLENIVANDRNGAQADFPWVSLRASGGTASAFRMTGLESDLTNVAGECIMVHVGASSAALPGDAEGCINDATISASEDGTWTATFRSSNLATALGITTEAINADVTFSVEIDDSIGAGNPQIERVLTRDGFVTGTGFDD